MRCQKLIPYNPSSTSWSWKITYQNINNNRFSAKYGHEYLLNGLCKELNEKCHVSQAKYATYSRVTSLSTFTTDALVGARIHACSLWEPEPELPDPDIEILSSTLTQFGSRRRKHVCWFICYFLKSFNHIRSQNIYLRSLISSRRKYRKNREYCLQAHFSL